MANGVKTYQIQINGITESVKAVESLNKELASLESRIKALEGKSVGVKTSGGGSKSSSTGSLSEEEKIAKQIEQIDAKRIAYSKEIYQNYLAAKDVLKETVKDQESIAASERLQANSYSNTIMGMKQELADIKSAMQTVDLGDTDQMDKMVQRANELNEALKKIEQSYGQFGRNVGNYQSAFDGLSKYKVEIDGVTREFNSAREAAKTLTNELLNLPKGAKGAEEIHKALLKIKSDIADLQKSSSLMDNLLDTMESFTAIANVGQGIRGLFGVDDAEMQKSIKNLVALQNILKGIETINKQMKTGKGVGGWIKPLNDGIDKAITKLVAFQTTLNTTSVAAKALSVSIKTATVALKAFKAALSLGISIAIDLVLEKVLELIDSIKEVSTIEDAVTKSTNDGAKAYAEASAKISGYVTKLKSFNGTKAEEKKLLDEVNKDMGTSIGQYKTIGEAQNALITKGEAYAKVMMLQAKSQALLNTYTENYVKLIAAQKNAAEGGSEWKEWLPWNWGGKSAQEKADDAVNEIKQDGEKILNEYNNVMKEIDEISRNNKLFNYSPQIEKNGKNAANAAKKVQDEITRNEIDAMKEGLNKKLRQLDEEERQTLNKIRENGRKSANEVARVQRLYDEKRKNVITEYLRKLESDIRQSAKQIAGIQFEINISHLKNEIDEITNEINKRSQDQPIINTLISKTETKEIKNRYRVDDSKLDFAKSYNQLFNLSNVTKDFTDFYKFLAGYIKDKNKELYQDIVDFNNAIYNEPDENKKEAYMKGLEETFDKVSNIIEGEYANELLFIRDYTDKTNQTLSDSLDFRLKAENEYNKNVREVITERLRTQSELNKKLVNEEINSARESEKERYDIQMSGLTAQKVSIKEAMKAIEDSYKFIGLEGAETIKESNKEIYQQYHDLFAKTVEVDAQIQKAKEQHKQKLIEITKEQNNRISKIETDAAIDISTEQEKLFNHQIQNIRDAQSKINELLSRQPVVNNFGIVNLRATKKQYNEIVDATKGMINEIIIQKQRLNVLWNMGLIKPEAMNAIKQQLNDLEQTFVQLFKQIEYEVKDTIPKFAQSCQVYIQTAYDSYSQIMNAVWDAQDTQFEKQQELLDKMNEELDKKLDEQQEIVERHKDAIDSIEEELENSRGARRQHLIDQINAEMAAQRAAQKQEQKIAKEKEALAKKQEKLDIERRKAEYKRNMLQAIVNGALAVTMAAVNAWPMPAIAMMAAAAASTAAQIAIMASNKPYAKGGQLDGGVAVGNRHRDGGIKVLGGRAEIEGGEFITNRLTTEKNIDLLDYINSKKKRINLDDLMEFYSSGKVKRNISSISPKAKFADGGTIPTISNDYAFDDRLISAFEDYSNRPVVVSVVDINNRQSAVKNVQVLAGLSE